MFLLTQQLELNTIKVHLIPVSITVSGVIFCTFNFNYTQLAYIATQIKFLCSVAWYQSSLLYAFLIQCAGISKCDSVLVFLFTEDYMLSLVFLRSIVIDYKIICLIYAIFFLVCIYFLMFLCFFYTEIPFGTPLFKFSCT